MRVDFPRGTELRLAGPDGVWELASPWIGEELARCAAMAAALGADSGLGCDRVRDGLAALRPIPERLEAVLLPSGAWLLCDSWRSTPETIESALPSWAASRAGVGSPCSATSTSSRKGPRPRHTSVRPAGGGGRRADPRSRQRFREILPRTRQSGLAPGRVQICRDVYQAAAELARAGAGDRGPDQGSHRQKLGRLRLLLAGAAVRCGLRTCPRTGRAAGSAEFEKVSEASEGDSA